MAKKKLLSEAQVRKFMGLANLDANMSSNFISENWGEKEDEYKRHDVDGVEKKAGDEDGHYKDYEMNEEEEEVSMDVEAEMEEPDAEGGDDGVDVELDEDEVTAAKAALDQVSAVLAKLLGDSEGAADEMEMDAEMPPMDMDVEAEEEIELEEKKDKNWGGNKGDYKRRDVDGVEKKVGDKDGHYKDYEMDEAKIVAEVTRRVAKRLNEAVRAQKKANKLLGK